MFLYKFPNIGQASMLKATKSMFSKKILVKKKLVEIPSP